VSDALLDREIESLLAVEPSPEFVARVRTRVAQEPEQGRWRSVWMFAVAGTVAVVIVAVIAWPSREPAPPSSTSIDVPRLAKTVETITPPTTTERQPLASRRQSGRRAATVTSIARDREFDIDLREVVVAENEARAFASLVASIRQHRFDAAMSSAPNPDTPLEIKELPPVEPLEIEPIVKLAALQAEGERP
jgi:hypothetical protein